MVTMLDCIKRIPSLLEKIADRAEENYKEILRAFAERGFEEIYLIGSGTSYNAAMTARYFAESASGMRVTAVLPNDFLYGFTVRNPKALYIFISQTGTSTITMEALRYVKEKGFLSAGVSESPDTPVALKADLYLDMGCGREEYGMRTIGYSTCVLTLQWLGVEIGRAAGRIGEKEYEGYKRQVQAAARNIPVIIDKAMKWMDTSRRRMMKSLYFSFTGAGALSGVALEASVKIWEAPQFPSGGFELDEGMHGPNYGYNYNHAVFVLNDGGFGNEKALALAGYMKNEHGNGYIIGVGAMDQNDLDFTPAGGPFLCLEYAAAVQVLMYRLSVDGGRDFSILGVHAKMNSYFQSHTDVKQEKENE